MRSIIIHADSSPAMESRLQTGLMLARRMNGHVRLLVSTPFQRFVSTDPFGGMYLANEALGKAQDLATDTAAQLSERMTSEDIAWDIVQCEGDLVGDLACAASLADLVIVSMDENGKTRTFGPSMLAADLATATPVPVLALPASAPPVDLDLPAMVAWNGSPQSAHALRSAVPLLAGGRQVDLVSVGNGEGQLPPTDALAYLSRHNIHAESRTVERGAETVEEALSRAARDMGAGLIVMGAFGHSRLRETIFGGVTQYMIDDAEFPLLLAH